jgi:hypothetical protein
MQSRSRSESLRLGPGSEPQLGEQKPGQVLSGRPDDSGNRYVSGQEGVRLRYEIALVVRDLLVWAESAQRAATASPTSK